jgi:methanogenic corrinoid protein MtbC1
MEDSDYDSSLTSDDIGSLSLSERHFIAADVLARDDVVERQSRLSQIVSSQIVPRLLDIFREDAATIGPSAGEIVDLAHYVLDPDLNRAAAFVTTLRDRGMSMETLFVDLLEPAARHLGVMWDNDECDFIDVTLGVGRLQKLLSVFNGTHDIPALDRKRRVLMATTSDEEHSFGLAMVQKFLSAGGWSVDTRIGSPLKALAQTVRQDWFAVAGLTVSSESHLDSLTAAIKTIRAHSRNPAIGVMVGGPLFVQRPALVEAVGADATAVNAPAAVIVAQKLFDLGAARNWDGSA